MPARPIASANQLITFSDPLLNAVTQGSRWILDSSRTLTWGTADNGTYSYLDPLGSAATIATALSKYSEVANINFQYVGHYASPLETPADMTFSIAANELAGALFPGGSAIARAFFPYQALTDWEIYWMFGHPSFYPNAEGDVWLNYHSGITSLPFHPGSEGFFVLLHEIGHALGLKHPHDNGGTGRPTFARLGLSADDRIEFSSGDFYDVDLFTAMSYNDDFSFNLWSGNPATLMPLDVIAIQALYGQNRVTNAGNSTHFVSASGLYQTIWDAGGSDWISAAGSSGSWAIGLHTPTDHPLLARHFKTLAVAFPVSDSTSVTWAFNAEHVQGSAQDDFIWGNSQANMLLGEGGIDWIAGFGGDDSLLGGPGADFLEGNSGNDILDGGTGADILQGGTGGDFYVVDADDTVIEAAGSGTDLIETTLSAYTTPANVERLQYLGSASFFGTGNNLTNRLIAGSGNDTLNGLGGTDHLSGLDGHDLLDGGSGADTMLGGLGNDTFVVTTSSDRVVERVGEGVDTVVTAISTLSLNSLQRDSLLGQIENLTYVGTARFTGSGNALGNIITGGNNNDKLSGAGGNDTLIGGAFSDTLIGGTGEDVLDGGADGDTLVFNTAARVGNADQVVAFVPGLDKLHFSNAVFKAVGRDGSLQAKAFAAGFFVSGQEADDRLIYDVSTGNLYYDSDGSGLRPSVLVATLTGAPDLSAADIRVI